MAVLSLRNNSQAVINRLIQVVNLRNNISMKFLDLGTVRIVITDDCLTGQADFVNSTQRNIYQ